MNIAQHPVDTTTDQEEVEETFAGAHEWNTIVLLADLLPPSLGADIRLILEGEQERNQRAEDAADHATAFTDGEEVSTSEVLDLAVFDGHILDDVVVEQGSHDDSHQPEADEELVPEAKLKLLDVLDAEDELSTDLTQGQVDDDGDEVEGPWHIVLRHGPARLDVDRGAAEDADDEAEGSGDGGEDDPEGHEKLRAF